METVIEHIKIDDEFIKSNDDPMKIISPVWWSATIYDGEEKYNESLAPFSKEQRNVYALLWYLAEVENGGHDQFYFNSTGIVWKDALLCSKILGLDEVSKIIEESAVKMGGEPSLDREARQEQLDKYEPDFTELDSRLYEIDNQIYERIYQYVLENKRAFYFNDKIKIPKRWAKKQ
ncbi:MAG: DMP19 family protein [Anaerolineales bacterium]|nr:DMP19 family protein [Anaerolineales bacterium]